MRPVFNDFIFPEPTIDRSDRNKLECLSLTSLSSLVCEFVSKVGAYHHEEPFQVLHSNKVVS